jgi:hypothetical protein
MIRVLRFVCSVTLLLICLSSCGENLLIKKTQISDIETQEVNKPIVSTKEKNTTPSPTQVPTQAQTINRDCSKKLEELPENIQLPGQLVTKFSEGLFILNFMEQDLRSIPGWSTCSMTSPNGKWLAYCIRGESEMGEKLIIESANGQSAIQMPVDNWSTWSGGHWLDNEHVWFSQIHADYSISSALVINPFTGKLEELSPDFPDLERYLHATTTDPAGYHFGYSSVVYDPSLNLAVYPMQVEDKENYKFYVVLWDRKKKQEIVKVPDNGRFGHFPLWLPDARGFLLASEPNINKPKQEEWLWVSEIGQVQQLTKLQSDSYWILPEASFSPDERYLAFWLMDWSKDNLIELVMLDLKTLEIKNTCLHGHPGILTFPIWSPDSQYVSVINNESEVVVLNIRDNWIISLERGQYNNEDKEQWPIGWMTAP